MWYGIASRTWARTLQLSVEAASCNSFGAILELYQRHLVATTQDVVESSLQATDLSRRQGMPR
jgi:hypothetical protein